MRILAIDTASQFGSIAISENGIVVNEVSLHSTVGFSHILFAEIEHILNRAGWQLSSIGCFAAGAGPGSFTGVRVALSAVKGLAEALGASVLGISNLQALASFGSSRSRAALIDARRGEVFAAIYDQNLDTMTPEVVVALPVWLASLPVFPCEVISSDLSNLLPLLPEGLAVAEQRSLAGAIAGICYQKLTGEGVADPVALDANYVRKSDAELLWKDR